MFRIIKWIFTGDWHLHKWKFSYVSAFNENIVECVKICEVCGKHQSVTLYNCSATTADELNL